jgi:beta-barrel assembly-enhancing protease
MKVLNAFAVPGDRIIITRELIVAATSPDEVAGVLAHEMGHVVHRDSEAQMVRVTGLQVLLSIATGSNGGGTASNMAGLAAILQYSREAERAADAFALATLTKAQIDPMGIKRFFEMVLKMEGEQGSGTLARIGNMFSTHPGTEERISNIVPLPAGVTPKPPLTTEQWEALKNICG